MSSWWHSRHSHRLTNVGVAGDQESVGHLIEMIETHEHEHLILSNCGRRISLSFCQFPEDDNAFNAIVYLARSSQFPTEGHLDQLRAVIRANADKPVLILVHTAPQHWAQMRNYGTRYFPERTYVNPNLHRFLPYLNGPETANQIRRVIRKVTRRHFIEQQ